MWLYDTAGRFYSAVQHRDDEDQVVVRARVRADAEHLALVVNEGIERSERMILGRTPAMGPAPAPVQVVSYEHSDYPWRVIMPRYLWASYVSEQAHQITYGNYKANVAEREAEVGNPRLAVLHDVWAANLRLERIDRPGTTWEHDDDGWDDPPLVTLDPRLSSAYARDALSEETP